MNTVLILGGTGKTGRRIARLLDDVRVRPASRTSRDHRIDLDDPSTWPPALDGVSAVYLVDPATERQERIPAFVTAAVDAGVRRLVLLSAPRAGEATHPLHTAEQAVRGSGAADRRGPHPVHRRRGHRRRRRRGADRGRPPRPDLPAHRLAGDQRR